MIIHCFGFSFARSADLLCAQSIDCSLNRHVAHSMYRLTMHLSVTRSIPCAIAHPLDVSIACSLSFSPAFLADRSMILELSPLAFRWFGRLVWSFRSINRTLGRRLSLIPRSRSATVFSSLRRWGACDSVSQWRAHLIIPHQLVAGIVAASLIHRHSLDCSVDESIARKSPRSLLG